MDNQTEEEVQETLETPAEEVSTEEEEYTTEETLEGDDDSEGEETETVESLKERLRKAERAIEKSKQKAKEERKIVPSKKKEEGDDVSDATLARLENRGVMEQEDQEYVLRVARAEGVPPIEALKMDFVGDRLAANKRAREQQAATPKSSKRTGTGGTDVDTLVRKYQERGELPDDPKLVAQILDRLTKS